MKLPEIKSYLAAAIVSRPRATEISVPIAWVRELVADVADGVPADAPEPTSKEVGPPVSRPPHTEGVIEPTKTPTRRRRKPANPTE